MMNPQQPDAADALVIVDVQHDFLPGGALAVPEGHQIIRPIIEFGRDFNCVALTRDWHPDNHISFSDEPQFVDGSWPPHCVENTPGALIDSEIREAFPNAPIFSKGTVSNTEAYSGFDGWWLSNPLLEYLDSEGVQTVYVVGLALDYCVRATAIDAVGYGFTTNVPVAFTRPVAYETGALAVYEMTEQGVIFS